MSDHLEIMRRVGKVLIVGGFIDICFMVYCIANGKGYSSSLNIFAFGRRNFPIKTGARAEFLGTISKNRH